MVSNQKERLLIISNNVLSTTRNNGKTILSYVDSLDVQNVAQLYFNGEYPSVEGYRYFQITDKDVLRGFFSKSKRGRAIFEVKSAGKRVGSVSPSRKLKKNIFRFFRELLWKNRWKSKKLFDWLDDFAPTAVFFVGGDCVFAYDICEYIVKRYGIRSSLYITDDYIMPRKNEGLISTFRRKKIKKSIERCLQKADAFFTVSDLMRREYCDLFGRDSSVIVNLSESLQSDEKFPENESFVFTYAGSLYYGRDRVLGKIAETLKKYNQTHEKKAILNVYSNSEPAEEQKKIFVIDGAGQYCGSLTKDELKIELNRSDVLVFAESFDAEQIEKTKYSLSTKVPEYLSVGKPILAVGPAEIGSMIHLASAIPCVHSLDDLENAILSLLESEAERKTMSESARAFFVRNHGKTTKQQEFLSLVFGGDHG